MPLPGQSPEQSSVTGALRVLLADLIDYAGLFPPAGLDMKTAVENYARYRRGEHAWTLGRFVLLAARLSEFEKCMPAGEDQPWRLSVLVGPKLDDDIAALEAFGPRCELAVIDCVETKVASAEDVSRAHARIGTATLTYYEVPLSPELPSVLGAIKSVGGRAKIRTGGLTANAFPSTEAVANFLVECAKRDLAFKATAGLHHPVRCVKPFTYAADSPSGAMHGFLNVAMAAAAAWASGKTIMCDDEYRLRGHPMVRPFPVRFNCNDARIQSVLQRVSPPFQFQEGGCDEPLELPITVLRQTRQNFFISFGSCSFEEPVADLRELNLL